jgi:hypothetical protein
LGRTVSFQHATTELAYVPTNQGGFNGPELQLQRLTLDDGLSRVIITFNPSNGNYTVENSIASASFTPVDRTTSAGYVDTYSKQGAGLQDSLAVYANVRAGASTATPPITLSYLSYGIWFHTNLSSLNTSKTYFIFGEPTAPADVPKAGTATYLLTVSGNQVETGPTFGSSQIALGGSGTMSADFTTGRINTELTLVDNPQTGLIGTYQGSGTINSNIFTGSLVGSLSQSVTTNDGHFSGGFFGPAAGEAGYAFEIFKHNTGFRSAASFAPEFAWLVGVAVGKKN